MAVKQCLGFGDMLLIVKVTAELISSNLSMYGEGKDNTTVVPTKSDSDMCFVYKC